jgi:RNA polymerase sigma-70 factor (sigma-E family)
MLASAIAVFSPGRAAGPLQGTFRRSWAVNRVMTDFDEFVAMHVDDLLRTAYLIVWEEAEAEDLVQECLLKVARRWPRIRRMEQPRAYARRILVNLAVDGARGRARRRSERDVGASASPIALDPLSALDTRAELLQVLGQLPARQRAVLVLRYFNDLTEAQVADVLGCSPGTVKSSASRGLARLREALQPISLQPRSTET